MGGHGSDAGNNVQVSASRLSLQAYARAPFTAKIPIARIPIILFLRAHTRNTYKQQLLVSNKTRFYYSTAKTVVDGLEKSEVASIVLESKRECLASMKGVNTRNKGSCGTSYDSARFQTSFISQGRSKRNKPSQG